MELTKNDLGKEIEVTDNRIGETIICNVGFDPRDRSEFLIIPPIPSEDENIFRDGRMQMPYCHDEDGWLYWSEVKDSEVFSFKLIEDY